MHLLSLAATALIAADDGGGNGSAAVVQLGILLLIPVAMYFLMIRPQRRRMREQATLQSSLEVGDEILTTTGMYGFITGFDEEHPDRVWIEIDDDVQVRLAKAAIQGKVDTSATPGRAAKAADRDASVGADGDAVPGDGTE